MSGDGGEQRYLRLVPDFVQMGSTRYGSKYPIWEKKKKMIKSATNELFPDDLHLKYFFLFDCWGRYLVLRDALLLLLPVGSKCSASVPYPAYVMRKHAAQLVSIGKLTVLKLMRILGTSRRKFGKHEIHRFREDVVDAR